MLRNKASFVVFVLVLVAAAYVAAPQDNLRRRPLPRRRIPRYDTNTDRFFSDTGHNGARKLHGALSVRPLLTRAGGDSAQGAVLTTLNGIWSAELGAGKSTDTIVLDGEQYIIHVTAGEGSVLSTGDPVELSEGMAILAPPGVGFVLSAADESPLVLYIIAEPLPDGFAAGDALIVRSDYDSPISSNTARADDKDALFRREDGLATIAVVDVVIHEPKAALQPHVHPREVEEIWAAVDGGIVVQMGMRRHTLGSGEAYRSPSDARTPHTNINTTDQSIKMLWLMAYPPEETASQPASPRDTI